MVLANADPPFQSTTRARRENALSRSSGMPGVGGHTTGHATVSEVPGGPTTPAKQVGGPRLASYLFGDGIDLASPVDEVFLYVELPFWLMMPPGTVTVSLSGTDFDVEVCPPWMEVHAGHVLDSRRTVAYHGPLDLEGEPSEDLAERFDRDGTPWLRRPCKTVLRLAARAHAGALARPLPTEPSRVAGERDAYRASLCEAHIPVVNELVQRYRLATWDHVPYEVSAWDVPVWWVDHADALHRTVLVPYKEWDAKPVTVGPPVPPATEPHVRDFELTTAGALQGTSSGDATPGELDLLDARSLMERGDYTGAVRRTVTAIEAVLRSELLRELAKTHAAGEAERLTAKTDNNFHRRLAQWTDLVDADMSQSLLDDLATTRKIRHEIVHRGRRLTHEERGTAQRAWTPDGGCTTRSRAVPSVLGSGTTGS